VINPLEAVADAIMSFEGWKPGSRSYRNRNPGNLERGQEVDVKNYDVFDTFVEGYQALLNELHAKFTGHNTHGIGPDSTLLDLFNVYAPPSDSNPTNIYCKYVAAWCSLALGRSISPETKLGDLWKSSS
jgi:hypothetical protein